MKRCERAIRVSGRDACAGLLLASGLLVCGAGWAGGGAEDDINAAMRKDTDNVVMSLKNGESAQRSRWNAQMQKLDPDTQALLKGETAEAQAAREQGADTKHRHDNLKRREKFSELLADDAPPANKRAPVRRNLDGRAVVEIPEGRAAAVEAEPRARTTRRVHFAEPGTVDTERAARRVHFEDPDVSARTAVERSIAADGDNVVKSLKTGEVALQHRQELKMRELDPDLQARLRGETAEAQALREQGADTKHRHDDLKRRAKFDEILADDAPRNGERPSRARSTGTEAHAASSAEAEPRASRTRRPAVAADAPDARVRADADAPTPGTSKGGVTTGGVAKSMVKGMAVGWAADTALGTHVPDAFDAAKWTGDTLQRPQEMPQRVGELATGAVQFTGKVATQLTRPDQMAVNLGKGAVGLAKYGAHMVTHPVEAVNTVGNTVVGTGTAVVGLGMGLAKGAATVVDTGVRAIVPPKVARSPVVKAVTAPVRAVSSLFTQPTKSGKKKNANCQMGFLFGSIRPGC